MSKRLLTLGLAASMALTTATSVVAEEKRDIDPANPTIVLPKLRLDYGSTESGQGQSRILGSLSGAYSSGSQFMGSLEMEQQAGETKYYRGQYFQVFETGSSILPKAGFSLDYINNKSASASSVVENITALGLVGEIETPVSFMKFFPQVAYLRAGINDSAGSPGSLLDKGNLTGYQIASHFSFYLNEKGSYIHYNPQYNDLDRMKTMTHTINIGTPMREDKTMWAVMRIESVSNKSKDLGMSSWENTTNDNRFMLGVNMFL